MQKLQKKNIGLSVGMLVMLDEKKEVEIVELSMWRLSAIVKSTDNKAKKYFVNTDRLKSK